MSVRFMDVCARLEKLNILRRIELNKVSANVGLYVGQLPVLEYIIHNDGCTQKEIADILRVTPASIATSTKRLQKAGLIQKQTDKDNLRRNMLSVTDKGYELAKKCRDSFDAFDKKLFTGFSEHDLLSVKNHLDRLIANVSDKIDDGIDFYSLIALKNEAEKNSNVR